MVKVYTGTPYEYYMDGWLVEVYEDAKKYSKKDWDMIFIVDGYEGSGKTVFTQQGAKYCDVKFDLNHMAFNPPTFENYVRTCPPGSSIVYDEAFFGLNSRSAMSKVNRSIVNLLTTIRKKNLFIFIVLPSFFDLDKYVVLHRARGLFHVYADNWERGYFDFYSKDELLTLWLEGKKTYKYNRRLKDFNARFTNHWVVDKDKYETKKDKDAIFFVKEAKPEHVIRKKVMEEVTYRLANADLGLMKKEIAKILGVTRESVRNYIVGYEERIKEGK